uniref:Novel protein similar to vertebrate importin 8 (inferred by orthology to a zebrafish protein) n=1 Tax=Strongyloides venezuelensis TaxID=75913 RepID=A0A0K0F0I1_STRVS
MERVKIIEALKATTNSEHQKEANQYLTEIEGMTGFAQVILEILVSDAEELVTRQAAAIFFKNFVYRAWNTDGSEEENAITIPDADKEVIRQHIIDCIVKSPSALQVQLLSASQTLIRSDYPDKWPQFYPTIVALLQTTTGENWNAGLNLLYRMAKVYEYRRGKDKTPMIEVMSNVFPYLYERVCLLLSDLSQESVFIQKLVLKIFYRIVQCFIPKDFLKTESLLQWIKLCVQVLETATPPELESLDSEDKASSIWWKHKKWAAKIVSRFFEKYGVVNTVEPEHEGIAAAFNEHLTIPCIEQMLKLCLHKANGGYVSDQVIYYALSHIATGIAHSKTWKAVKPHLFEITEKLMFPLLKHTEEDEELWEDDPAEYIQLKYNYFDEIHDPSTASVLVIQAAAKRKDILPSFLTFLLNTINNSQNPTDVDGSLHMIGELATSLVKNKKFKGEVEKLIETQFTSRLSSDIRFLRARACWCIKQYSECSYRTPKYLNKVLEGLFIRLTQDSELPVKVEAAIAIQSLIENQPNVAELLKPRVKDILTEVLRLVAETEVEELTPVMEDLIETFMDDMIPIAHHIVNELANLFTRLIESSNTDPENDRTITIMGVLSTMVTILSLIEDRPEVITIVEPTVHATVSAIFKSYASDFYEEAFSMVQSCIATKASPAMWGVFDDIIDTMETDASTFYEIMPVLHTYLCSSSEGFLAQPDRLQKVLALCEKVLKDLDYGEDNQLHAAKFLECIIVECGNSILEIHPNICQLVLERLQHDVDPPHEELKPRCLLVLIAAFYVNSEGFLSYVNNLEPHKQGTLEYIYFELLKNVKSIEGYHDRKLAILALLMALQLPQNIRPKCIDENGGHITSVLIDLFDEYQKCIKGQFDSESGDSDVEQSGDESELDDDEDEVDEFTLEFERRKSIRKAKILENGGVDPGSDFDSDEDAGEFNGYIEETEVDAFNNKLDLDENLNIYTRFLDVFQNLQTTDATLFQKMTQIEAPKAVDLEKLVNHCQTVKLQIQSKNVEASGGFHFDPNTSCQQNFNFSQ